MKIYLHSKKLFTSILLSAFCITTLSCSLQKYDADLKYQPDKTAINPNIFDYLIAKCRLNIDKTINAKMLQFTENPASPFIFSDTFEETYQIGLKYPNLRDLLEDNKFMVLNRETKVFSCLAGHFRKPKFFFTSNNILISFSNDNTIRIWDIPTRSSLILIGHEARIACIVPHPDANIKVMVSSDISGKIIYWNIETNQNMCFFHNFPIENIKFNEYDFSIKDSRQNVQNFRISSFDTKIISSRPSIQLKIEEDVTNNPDENLSFISKLKSDFSKKLDSITKNEDQGQTKRYYGALATIYAAFDAYGLKYPNLDNFNTCIVCDTKNCSVNCKRCNEKLYCSKECRTTDLHNHNQFCN